MLCVSVCVQWPEGRCFHDVPESALLNLYFEIRENCHGFSWRRCQENGNDGDHGRAKQRRSTKLIVAELRSCSEYRDRQWKSFTKSFTIFVCFFPQQPPTHHDQANIEKKKKKKSKSKTKERQPREYLGIGTDSPSEEERTVWQSSRFTIFYYIYIFFLIFFSISKLFFLSSTSLDTAWISECCCSKRLKIRSEIRVVLRNRIEKKSKFHWMNFASFKISRSLDFCSRHESFAWKRHVFFSFSRVKPQV